MIKWFEKKMRQKQTQRELQSLSVRELNDIGIGWGDIERIVQEVE